MVKDDSNQTGNVFVKYASTGEINARQIGADSEVSPATEVTWEDYARAERFLPQNIGKLAFRLEITPNWIGKGDCFWYKVDTREGKAFMYVDPDQGIRTEAFDHVKLAAELSRASRVSYVHYNLPFDSFHYVPGSDFSQIVFDVNGTSWKFDINTGEIEEFKGDDHTSASQDSSGRPSLESQPEPEPQPANRPMSSSAPSVICDGTSLESLSPDGKWAVFVRDFNLYARDTLKGEIIRLTEDGDEEYHYAVPFKNPLIDAGLMDLESAQYYLKPAIVWAPDSKKFLTYKVNRNGVGKCHLVQSCPLDGSKRPKLISYAYPLPGDENVPLAEPVVVYLGLGQRTQRLVKLDVEPVQQLYYGAPYCWTHWTSGEDERIYLLRRERGYTVRRLYVFDPETGEGRVLIEEKSPTALEHYPPFVIDNGKEIIWHSEQDGWAHLYLCDGTTGAMKRQITQGPWVVREVKYVDELERVVYFTGSGLEPGRDVYFRHLYKVGLDNNQVELLTPEDAEHQITFTPSGKYFLDRYSRVDLAPSTVLRRCDCSSDSSLVLELETADLDLLFETGWSFPERFCVKARDGITDIYGMIVRPSNFDPSKTYPVIEANYSGPQTIRTPKAFGESEGSRQFWQDQAISELGFIVVTVDGLGMAFRSKWFQDHSYRNLGDAGMPDHIGAFRQLADKYPYMDLSRVGIYGGSAGGYAAGRAILEHPDFFKVAVVWAGNHDHRTDKASWIERYMGLPVGPHYEEQANPAIAENLQGHLLIMHGEMDENVPPAASLQLVDALIKANKDFDFLILPNGCHSDGYHPYITRKRWDYFVKHLLGGDPPKGYRIKG